MVVLLQVIVLRRRRALIVNVLISTHPSWKISRCLLFSFIALITKLHLIDHVNISRYVGLVHLAELDFVDNDVVVPEQVDLFLPLPEGLHIDGAHLGFESWDVIGGWLQDHLPVEREEGEVHLAVGVEVQLGHEPNLKQDDKSFALKEILEVTMGLGLSV